MRPSWFSLLLLLLPNLLMLLSNVVALCVCLSGWLGPTEKLFFELPYATRSERESIPKFYYPRHTREEKSSHCAWLPFSLQQQLLLGAAAASLVVRLFFSFYYFLKKEEEEEEEMMMIWVYRF